MKNTEVKIISFFDERESRINLFNLFFCLWRISDVWISEICASNILIFCRDLVWTYSMCLRGHKIWLNLQFGIYSRWSYNDILKLWWHQRYWRSTPVVLVHWLIAKFFFCGEHFLVTCFMCVKKGWKGVLRFAYNRMHTFGRRFDATRRSQNRAWPIAFLQIFRTASTILNRLKLLYLSKSIDESTKNRFQIP